VADEERTGLDLHLVPSPIGDVLHCLWIKTCEVCGADAHVIEAADVSTFGDSKPRQVPTRVECSTPRCGEVCKVCRRDPGDVHGPDCGDLMALKVERPHIVDRSDCR
jgi:hypothetical protein